MKKNIFIWLHLLLILCLSGATSWAAEQWKISFNGYPGVMELSGNRNSYTGRFNLHGSWEDMLDLRVFQNAIFFRRASADQKYLGIIDGNKMSGIFSQGGWGSYPWSAEKSAGWNADTVAEYKSELDGTSMSNLALKKTARQSSTGYGGNPERAVDGNRDGNYNSGSISHTNNMPNEWWEVDLGGQKQIGTIKLWNRTDCCSERLSNFHVMVSPQPFLGGNLQAVLNDSATWSYHNAGVADRETTIPVSVVGRYVRVQLAGQNWLSLAEVEVFGKEAGADRLPTYGDGGGGIPVTIYWHMADDADVYLNGRPLRQYTPSFKTRPDEAPQPAFSARASLRNGDVFTVGGRRGGSFGLMLIAVDASGRVVFKTDRTSWGVYEPGNRDDWYDPAVATVSDKRQVTVQTDPWYPQKELNVKFNNVAASIWSEPSNQFAYLYGVVTLWK
ncbi:MAG: discoidin domain-containing protein [Deltaproteobacteria bacterium]